MNKQQVNPAVNAQWQVHQMMGGQQQLCNPNMLAEMAQAIVVQQVGCILEDDFYSNNFYSFDYQELTFRSPIVQYLIDQVSYMQLQNGLMIEVISEGIDEIQQDLIQTQKHMEAKEKDSQEVEKQPAPKKLIFQGKEISQADYEVLIEYTIKNHIESMTTIDKSKKPYAEKKVYQPNKVRQGIP